MNVQKTALFLTAAAALLLFSTALGAATVLKMDMNTLVTQSDAIVIGEVTSIEARQEQDGRVYTTIDLRIDEAVKGKVGETLRLRQVGGRDREADIATYVPGMPYFEPEERVFLFVTHGADQTSMVTGMAQGKFHIAVGPDTRTEYVIPQLQDLRVVTPETHSPPTDPSSSDLQDIPPALLAERHARLFERVHEFDTFRHQVRALVDGDPKAN